MLGQSSEVRARLRRVEDYFSLQGFEHEELFQQAEDVWDVLLHLESYIDSKLRPAIRGEVAEGAFVSDRVYLAPGAVVEPGAMVKGPAIIGPGAVIRHGAYVREYVIVGEKCVVGHATELKRVVMLDGSQAPHFNYVGDSVLGRGVNLGAGTRLANLKNDGSEVVVRMGAETLSTGLRKFGAILGDGVHTGCNVVTSPGTLVGPGCLVYPGTVLRGVYPARQLIKLRQEQEVRPLDA